MAKRRNRVQDLERRVNRAFFVLLFVLALALVLGLAVALYLGYPFR
jgi:cell division septal protein FtsQ